MLQKSVYYINKVLYDVETKYFKLEKIVYALVISTRRLHPYFQAHMVIMLIDQAIRIVLH